MHNDVLSKVTNWNLNSVIQDESKIHTKKEEPLQLYKMTVIDWMTKPLLGYLYVPHNILTNGHNTFLLLQVKSNQYFMPINLHREVKSRIYGALHLCTFTTKEQLHLLPLCYSKVLVYLIKETLFTIIWVIFKRSVLTL
jgi:hypothetical protein